MERPDWIEVGRVVRPHGVRGEVRVSPDTDNPDRFRPGSRLSALCREEERRELEIESVRGEERFPIVAFVGVADRNEAESLKGCSLAVSAADLPELTEGEFYPWELVGLAVHLADGTAVGEVVEVLDAPANDVLVVEVSSGRRLMLPFVMEVVPEVDRASGRVVISGEVLPEDLSPNWESGGEA